MGFKIKKRKKNRRYRGSKGCGGGFRQKRRGKGNTGGKGMSGTGKRSNQKMGMGQKIAKAAGFEKYFGRRGYTSAPTARKINDVLNLEEIAKNFAGKSEIVLEGYKILGEGKGFKATIKAECASKSAIEKMEKAGGKIIVREVKEISVKKVEAVEKKTEKKTKVAKK
jgi:large subunit ribosomal protein L15